MKTSLYIDSDASLTAGLQNQLPLKQTNKNSTVQIRSEPENRINERRRQPSTEQKRNMNTLGIQIISTQRNQYCTQIFMYA